MNNTENDHFYSFVTSVQDLLINTSLRFEIVNKLKKEFAQLTNEIKSKYLSFSNPNTKNQIPFERNMSQLSSLCQRIYFASKKKDKDPKFILIFFGDLNYPIDLNDQYFDDDDFEDEDDTVVYLEFSNQEIFSSFQPVNSDFKPPI